MASEYEPKAAQLRTVLVDAGRNPDECYNLTSARIDLLEMQGDEDSLKLASFRVNSTSCVAALLVLFTFLYLFDFLSLTVF